MASPPKPWERAAGTSPSAAIPTSPSATTTASSPTSTEAPPLPDRPSSLANAVNQNAAAYSRVGAMGTMGNMGTSPYGTYGSAYPSPYSSPYSRFGGSYGGYGSGMYGYGGMGGMGGMYGGGMYGMGVAGGDPNSLTNRFSNSTAATFQMLEGMVTAFGGFAQMLESTYMATHSSFFAMISVAEQFGNLRDTMGSLLGIFTLIRWIRTLFAKLTGRPLPADATALTPAAFARFEGRAFGPDGSPQPPKASRKPLLFFLLAAFGLPYLMSKVIKGLAASAEEEEKRLQQIALQQQQPVDPSKLEFCRLLFDFASQQPSGGMELEARKGDLVAVLSKNDPAGNPSEWWHCRSRDGHQGYLPSTYLEVLRRPTQEVKKLKAVSESRTNSLTSSIATEEGKKEYATAGGMQRSHFYS